MLVEVDFDVLLQLAVLVPVLNLNEILKKMPTFSSLIRLGMYQG